MLKHHVTLLRHFGNTIYKILSANGGDIVKRGKAITILVAMEVNHDTLAHNAMEK